jgi:hypothetical protein
MGEASIIVFNTLKQGLANWERRHSGDDLSMVLRPVLLKLVC